MQKTYDCNGEGLPDYPTELEPKDVNVYMHCSGIACTHDYSCSVCRTNKAVLSLDEGLMQPCWGCQEVGYKLIKKSTKHDSLFKRLFDWS